MSEKISICVLFYGDYTELARRCLRSVESSVSAGQSHIGDFRFGLNSVSPCVHQYVTAWGQRIGKRYDIPVHCWQTRENAYKYPLMRRMFHDTPLHELVMWFDDDSYLDDPLSSRWWPAMLAEAKQHDMIGQFWLMPVQGNQLAWIRQQPWFNPAVPLPPPKKKGYAKPAFEFCQGAWWVAKSRRLLAVDWPVPELRHNGGDSMLGEVFRHQGWTMGRFHGGVHINAGHDGKASTSVRRGHSERRVGADFDPDARPDLSHQDFKYTYEQIFERAVEEPARLPIIDLYKTT